METLWTLHVEDFAGIERADIDVSPLTLFVGDNNSGKSYLLSLIYGLISPGNGGVLSNLCEDSAEYQECAEWVKVAFGEIHGNGNVEKPFDDYAYTIFENLWNRILQDNQKAILQSIFSASLSAGKIGVSFQRGKSGSMSLSVNRGLFFINLPFSDESFSINISNATENILDSFHSFFLKTTIAYTLHSMITQGFDNSFDDDSIFFLPTSRTGFLLTYPALTKDAFPRAYGFNQKQNINLFLTRPFTDFLGNLTTVNKRNMRETYQPIIGFIESNIIRGKILVSNDLPLPEFYYLPEGMETSLPMYLSSDVVKEIAPLILMLQYKVVDALFIEEPEMSLHLKLQQMMARTLIKIVNAGTPVFVATHSDTILQHVNNMVKLNNLPEARKQTLMKRFGFDADDPISADKISMYQFDVRENGKTAVTSVQALKCGDYGFEVPTFYDPLETLLEQTRATEPDAEEYED